MFDRAEIKKNMSLPKSGVPIRRVRGNLAPILLCLHAKTRQNQIKNSRNAIVGTGHNYLSKT